MKWNCNWHPAIAYRSANTFEAHMDSEHPTWHEGSTLVECETCQTHYVSSAETADLMGPRCMHCPPEPCPDCGEPDDRTCSCWVSIETLSLADQKALFAADGTFNIGVNGEVTVG